MKILRLLLTFYFVALLIIPCSDVETQRVVGHHSEISISSENSQPGSNDGTCSPFCMCNCSHVSVIAFKVEPLLEIPLQVQFYFSKKILFHKNNIAYQVYDHIWQPPKI
ncbi:hypothetical protein EG344_05325 [Chryseobacterium sp. G0162]|uniref:DUF6660 family protein n=1 Tax=Chryseobacterium sp. G0162 TaxID=2487063 RepID=UPI000F4F1153|nr:DUF6660 family protein [Chryseobacterium sp. G0162]AZB08320.1 hypothetical protein EG344_05325 [Chryseobacterium sp. G0162]